MPVVWRDGPYRFFFYASDRTEPRHVHVARDNLVAKFWLDPIRLQNGGGFARSELRRVERIVERHSVRFLEEWDGYFNG